jgi:hypothetical protein
MNSAQRRRAVKAGIAICDRQIKKTAEKTLVVLEFGTLDGHLLGLNEHGVIHDRRIAELLPALAKGAPLNTDVRAALERAALKPKTFVQWVRRQQPLVKKIIAEI